MLRLLLAHLFYTFVLRIKEIIRYMLLRFYQISIRYANKIHDFHSWGVAARA